MANLSRQPQQERSRARVQQIIDAADTILGTEGFDALTIRHLAEVADVPVGTIYQFFTDKNGVVDVIARRYLDRFAEVMTELVARAEQTPFVDLVDGVLDAFIEMYRSNPGYLAIWMGRQLSPDLLEADHLNNELLADGLRQIIVAQGEVADSDELHTICRAAVYVGDGLLQAAFRHHPSGDEALIAEAKRIERLYFEDALTRLVP
jgi:AcrR family transcriptional regulator